MQNESDRSDLLQHENLLIALDIIYMDKSLVSLNGCYDQQVEEVPEGFPFEIQDHPGLQTVTLKRTYQDEVIVVEVHMPDLVSGQDANDNDEDDDADDDNKANQSCIPLVVSVSKKTGPSLEFSCSAYPDEISIDSLIVKNPEHSDDQIAYEGPDFQ